MCRELIHEERAAKIRYRNTFGTQRVGGFIANAFDLYLKNPANTNVVEWGQRLLALWEVTHSQAAMSSTPLLAYYKNDAYTKIVTGFSILCESWAVRLLTL